MKIHKGWFVSIIFITLFVCSLFLMYIIYDSENSLRINGFDDYYFNTSCDSGHLVVDADCMIEFVRPIFKYNDTKDKVVLNYKEIRERGGDCQNWALFYERLAELNGYDSKVVNFKINDTHSHVVTIMSGQKGYCVLDQLYYKCVFF